MTQTPQDLVSEAKQHVPSISCAEYLKLKEEGADFVLIDVREKDEWDAGHIEGATHIPRGLVEFKIGDVVPEKDRLVIVQCKSGGRAALCGQTLQTLGYTNVKNLEGGYDAYCQQP